VAEPIAMSPTPRVKPVELGAQKMMDFPDAIREVIAGKKIYKAEWENKEFYGFLNGNVLSIHKPDGKNYQWVINDGDLMGNDWIVIG